VGYRRRAAWAEAAWAGTHPLEEMSPPTEVPWHVWVEGMAVEVKVVGVG